VTMRMFDALKRMVNGMDVGDSGLSVRRIVDVLADHAVGEAQSAAVKLVKDLVLQKATQIDPEVAKLTANRRTFYISGWRPAIGWVCVAALVMTFLINPVIQWVTGAPGPQLPTDMMTELVFALLGMGTLRTVEKFSGRTR